MAIKAIILAAGKGTRCSPLTLTRPKPLLKIFGKTILEHNLDQLCGLTKEVILVVKYKREMIESLIGSDYKGLKIKYVVQGNKPGTAAATKQAISIIDDKFILLYGDDLYKKQDIQECLKKFPCILLKEKDNPSSFGQVVVENGLVKKIVEKPKKTVSKLVNTGVYFMAKKMLNFEIKKSSRDEYEFTDYIKEFIKKEKLYFRISKNWIPISYVWNLLDANEYMLSKIKKNIIGTIEKNCYISENVVISKGALIKSGTYIEGPAYIGSGAKVGPNCYIRKFTTIGKGCHIGQAVEIKNSIIGDNSNVPHLSYVGDSIIGEKCNLAAGTVIANLRFDSGNIKTKVKGVVVDTKRRKLGCVFGDNVKTGVNVSLMPGVLIDPDCNIVASSVITRNIKAITKK